jgi:hypothetical protein
MSAEPAWRQLRDKTFREGETVDLKKYDVFLHCSFLDCAITSAKTEMVAFIYCEFQGRAAKAIRRSPANLTKCMVGRQVIDRPAKAYQPIY